MSHTKMKLCEYLVKESIGEGAFGTVSRGIHVKTAQTVALKIVKREDLCSVAENGSNQFQNELLIWEKLSHPHIISLIHVFQTFHEFGIVTEYAPHGDLKKLIRSGVPIPVEKSAFLFVQVTLAIEYLHNRDLCHRDIKADNVLMFSKNLCKLCDFGFCTESRKDKQQTKFCGTLTYLAPEILNSFDKTSGKCRYDGKKTDVWSLGVLLYLLIAKKLPFTGHSEAHIEDNIIMGYYPKLEAVPSNVNVLIRGMLCDDPKRRHTSENVLNNKWLIETTNWPRLLQEESGMLELNTLKAKRVLRGIGNISSEGDNKNMRSEESEIMRLTTTKLLNEQLCQIIDKFVTDNIKEEESAKMHKEGNVLQKLKKRLSRKSS